MKAFKPLVTGVSLFLLTTSLAISAEWKDLVIGSVKGNGMIVLIDAESVRTKGKATTAWLWYIYKKPVVKGVDNYKSLETIDCYERTKAVDFDVYQLGNNLVDSQKRSAKEALPIVPGTMESNVADALCSKAYAKNPAFPKVDVPIFQKAMP